jgi:hypothetical protein
MVQLDGTDDTSVSGDAAAPGSRPDGPTGRYFSFHGPIPW